MYVTVMEPGILKISFFSYSRRYQAITAQGKVSNSYYYICSCSCTRLIDLGFCDCHLETTIST